MKKLFISIIVLLVSLFSFFTVRDSYKPTIINEPEVIIDTIIMENNSIDSIKIHNFVKKV